MTISSSPSDGGFCRTWARSSVALLWKGAMVLWTFSRAWALRCAVGSRTWAPGDEHCNAAMSSLIDKPPSLFGSMRSIKACTWMPWCRSSCSRTLPKLSAFMGAYFFAWGTLMKASATRAWSLRQLHRRSSRMLLGANSRMPRSNSWTDRCPALLMSMRSQSALVSASESCTTSRSLCHCEGVRYLMPDSSMPAVLKARSICSAELCEPRRMSSGSPSPSPCPTSAAEDWACVVSMPETTLMASRCRASMMLRKRCRTFHRISSRMRLGSVSCRALSNSARPTVRFRPQSIRRKAVLASCMENFMYCMEARTNSLKSREFVRLISMQL
mmetsp:Transcript_13180/g.41585  ORF Transcript_13180/g.41585 Transcript_13180/m.41585 type:complete len:328 (-) Transcript_13180:720-1703(-)